MRRQITVSDAHSLTGMASFSTSATGPTMFDPSSVSWPACPHQLQGLRCSTPQVSRGQLFHVSCRAYSIQLLQCLVASFSTSAAEPTMFDSSSVSWPAFPLQLQGLRCTTPQVSRCELFHVSCRAYSVRLFQCLVASFSTSATGPTMFDSSRVS